MPFAPPRFVRADIDRATAGLVVPLVYRGRDQTFTVPGGFVTDFASVPRFLTWLVPTMGTYTRAAIVHDWLCTQLETLHRLHGNPNAAPASARDTDGVFRRIMREEGVPLARRWLIWCGVRWGAVANPARRAGWWRDAPAVLGISLLAAPVVVPAGLLVILALLVDQAVEAMTP